MGGREQIHLAACVYSLHQSDLIRSRKKGGVLSPVILHMMRSFSSMQSEHGVLLHQNSASPFKHFTSTTHWSN